jgi:hypothetical protein
MRAGLYELPLTAAEKCSPEQESELMAAVTYPREPESESMAAVTYPREPALEPMAVAVQSAPLPIRSTPTRCSPPAADFAYP